MAARRGGPPSIDSAWLSQGGQLIDDNAQQGKISVEGNDKLTLGLLLGLVCSGYAREWQLAGVTSEQRGPLAALCHALRGRSIGAGRYEGLEVRNGLAHGYAELRAVEAWVKLALAQNGPLDSLVRACMPITDPKQKPVALENPGELRAWLAR